MSRNKKEKKQILNDKKEVIFEGDATEMTLAFNYLTKPFYILAETMGLRMSDAYELNKKYWNDKTKNVKSFKLIDCVSDNFPVEEKSLFNSKTL